VYRARSAAQLAGLTADLPAVGLLARLRQWRLAASAAAPPEGLRLPLELVRDRPLTLGRGAHCDVVVRHDTVSRRHAELRRDGGACHVSDLGSSKRHVDRRAARGRAGARPPRRPDPARRLPRRRRVT